MVIRAALVALMSCIAATASAKDVDLATWARALPTKFSVSGSKTEPTYMAAIDIGRDGDSVAVLGGAPAWMERSLEAVSVDAGGAIRHVSCPNGMDCSGPTHPSGFLSTAALISASRKGTLAGAGKIEPFGTFSVVCVDAGMLGVSRPILDPCFEIHTGAAIAQKHRESRRFDGPSLDPVTVRIGSPSQRSLFFPSKDKAS
jgi:hypothetical protein